MYVLTSLVGIFELRCYTPSSSVRVGGVKEGEILQETLIGGENSFLVCDNSTLPSEWSRVLTFFLHGMCVGVGQGEVSCVLGFTFTLCSTGQDRGSNIRYVDVRTSEMSSICFRRI